MTIPKYTINKDYHLQQYSSLKKEQNFEIYVPHGGEYSLTLPDGTKVWLNAGTLLSYSSQPSSIRSVRLEGEAYFEVAKSKTPFEVKASGNTVHVLGTKFNVRAYPEQPFQVTLSEGNVQVYGNGKSMQLHPGQQLSAPDFQILTVDTNLYTSWTHGIFEFNNTPLNEIILQLERWYNVNMEFKTEELKKLRFTGTILKKESLGHSLEMIQKVSNIKFSKQDKCILIEKKES